jgi:hypothetical protein
LAFYSSLSEQSFAERTVRLVGRMGLVVEPSGGTFPAAPDGSWRCPVTLPEERLF